MVVRAGRRASEASDRAGRGLRGRISGASGHFVCVLGAIGGRVEVVFEERGKEEVVTRQADRLVEVGAEIVLAKPALVILNRRRTNQWSVSLRPQHLPEDPRE